jgi:hypothetical protein
MFRVRDLDDKVSLDTLGDHGLGEVDLLIPNPTLTDGMLSGLLTMPHISQASNAFFIGIDQP